MDDEIIDGLLAIILIISIFMFMIVALILANVFIVMIYVFIGMIICFIFAHLGIMEFSVGNGMGIGFAIYFFMAIIKLIR